VVVPLVGTQPIKAKWTKLEHYMNISLTLNFQLPKDGREREREKERERERERERAKEKEMSGETF
jgi:hypothetical protein